MLAESLAELLGPKGWIAPPDARPWSRDWLDRYGEVPLGVARPADTGEVAQVVAACHAAGVAVVPQGGNTGLCGAAVAERAGSIILSLSRLAAIDAPDPASATVTVQAGAVLANLHQRLDGSGLMFPLHLGAEGSAQIGGLIGTNAGGSHAFRFGMMSDLVLGLEAVLPDGTIWNGLRAVQKDNAGYALRKLFCGAEGTLGVVTRAVLRLSPEPKIRATALLALPDAEALVNFGTRLRAEAGDFLTGLEFFCDLGLSWALHHVQGLTFPLESRSPWYLLVEVASTSARTPLEEILQDVLEWGIGLGLVTDGAMATSEAQRSAFWRIREEQPEGQRLQGPQLKHDISVPPGRIVEFIKRANELCQSLLAGTRINPFGHLADGNIHYNISPPHGVGFGELGPTFALTLAGLADSMGGSFAAEHGLGRAKVAIADALRDPVERELMARIKRSIDAQGYMNPGVILPADLVKVPR